MSPPFLRRRLNRGCSGPPSGSPSQPKPPPKPPSTAGDIQAYYVLPPDYRQTYQAELVYLKDRPGRYAAAAV